MSTISDDYTDGNNSEQCNAMLPENESALSTLLRNSLIARIKGKNGNWINRWVELRDTHLFYYKDSQALDYINVIDLDGCDIGDFAGKPCSFVATKSGEKSYYFCTHTAEEVKKWKKALRKAISSSEKNAIPLPKPGALSFYISEKQLHVDVPMGDLYWWLETLCDGGEDRKTVMNSFYRNGDGFVKSAVAIAITFNGKILIGHLECIKNSVVLKFDSLETSAAPLLFIDSGRLQALLDKEKPNSDQKQSEMERSAKEKQMEVAINELEEQLRSEKESSTKTNDVAKMKEEQLQEALDKQANGIKALQELLQSEKDNSTKAKALADEKEKELQLAVEKGEKENEDLEKMVQHEKDSAAKAQALVDQKEQELQSALKEVNQLKKKLQMQSQSAHSTTEGSNAKVIKPGKVHNLVALFSRNESNELKEESQRRRPLQTQFSLPERKSS